MGRVLLPCLIFVFFISEGTVMQVFSPENYEFEMVLVPRFAIILIMIIAVHKSLSEALLYGIVAGLLYDILYTDFIGVYTFSMGVSAYIAGLSAKVIHVNLITGIGLSIVVVALLDIQVFGLYSIIGFIKMPFKVFLYDRLFPSLVLNSIFFILAYYPFRRLIVRIS